MARNAITSRLRTSGQGTPTVRWTSHAPPAAWPRYKRLNHPAQVTRAPKPYGKAEWFERARKTMNWEANTAGSARRPNTTTAASAIPVGGQIADSIDDGALVKS